MSRRARIAVFCKKFQGFGDFFRGGGPAGLPTDPPPLFSDPSLASVTVECGVLGSRTDFASVPVRLSD